MMVGPASVRGNLNVSTDRRKTLSVGAFYGLSDDRIGSGGSQNAGMDIQVQPSDNISFSGGPKFDVSSSGDQYVTATSVLPYNPTYGTRYLFADLEQRTFAMETRVDWTFTPSLSLQIYAQPLLSSGDYLQYKQLEAGQTFKFIGLTPTNVSGLQNVDFDADGSTDFSFRDRDFNVRSLVGNAVLWGEYRPGSTVFFVWQRKQSDHALVGDFDFARDTGALFEAPADDRFIIKANYWLGI